MGLSCYQSESRNCFSDKVSMPSWAWVVTVFFNIIKIVAIFCFNALMGLSCYLRGEGEWCFNALMGLSCYWILLCRYFAFLCFNALMGLSCYLDTGNYRLQTDVSMPSWAWVVTKRNGLVMQREGVSMPSWAWVVTKRQRRRITSQVSFNALMGLSCYAAARTQLSKNRCFNALMGLSCYGKNVQYFKFFMILFMHPCYL